MNLTVSGRTGGFTLVELLVSMTFLTILTLFLVSFTTQTGNIWRGTTGKIEQFSQARDAFESLTTRLSQATLNTAWDYDNPNTPTKYLRKSDLRFKCQPGLVNSHETFFQAPFGYSENSGYTGLENLLNTWGYYIDFNKDPNRPSFLTGLPDHYRFRLMEYMEPSENLKVYTDPANWLPATIGLRSTNSHVIAENVIALVLLPKLSPQEDSTASQLAPGYGYDSTTDGPNGTDKNFNTRNQLPPIVEVTMVAIDEASALRLSSGATAPDFGLGALFKDSSPLQRKADLKTLQDNLVSKKANFRVFTSDVAIRGAKWSRD